jgi:hypothetical protein
MKIIACSFVLLFLTVIAHADSTLYWCNTESYLAYEVRPYMVDSSPEHQVRTINYKNPKRVSFQKMIIPDGQVHRMTCEAKAIEIIQYEGKPTGGFKRYEVYFDGNHRVDETKWKKPDELPGTEPSSFQFIPRDKQGKQQTTLNLKGTPYQLIYRSSKPADPCKYERAILLHMPKESDFQVITFQGPAECGE